MKVYTKTGDKGTTSLVGGSRVAKNDARLDAYGTVDELNSWIGFVVSCGADAPGVRDFLTRLQSKLFDLGCCLATEKDSEWLPAVITDKDIAVIEKEIDRMEAELPRHDRFILPGGTKAASAANIARTVCRRAERIMVGLPDGTCPGQPEALRYVNRLSDYLFVLSRYLNLAAGQTESFWEKTEN